MSEPNLEHCLDLRSDSYKGDFPKPPQAYFEYAQVRYILSIRLLDRLNADNQEPSVEQSRFLAESVVMVELVRLFDSLKGKAQDVLAQHPLFAEARLLGSPQARDGMLEKLGAVVIAPGIQKQGE